MPPISRETPRLPVWPGWKRSGGACGAQTCSRRMRSAPSQRGYMIHSGGLARLLDRHLPYRRLEEAPLPCHIIATDMLEGIEIRLCTGSAVQALLASAAIPGVFPAVQMDGHYVVDGGVANHTPISAAVELGATRLVVLPTGYSCALQAPPGGWSDDGPPLPRERPRPPAPTARQPLITRTRAPWWLPKQNQRMTRLTLSTARRSNRSSTTSLSRSSICEAQELGDLKAELEAVKKKGSVATRAAPIVKQHETKWTRASGHRREIATRSGPNWAAAAREGRKVRTGETTNDHR
jgi:predicted acylesterase/phospholipase RssA